MPPHTRLDPRLTWAVPVLLAGVAVLCASGCVGTAENIDDRGGADGSVGSRDGGTSTIRDGGTGRDGGSQSVQDGGGSIETSDGGCPEVRCDGRCGPVRDFCRGEVKQCGGCSSGKACDLVDHVCVDPALTCQALGAECGTTRNSCGTRLNCGACGSGKECDRNTHTCVTCSAPSCGDLGYECGSAWLGCGPFTNTTECGPCGGGKTCNTALHRCEPQCTPPTDAVVCAAAGATCGLISNGCGGMASCGTCGSGTSCGARGIGNRCDLPETPDECLAANRTCGALLTACGSAGATISCGTCNQDQICGPNGQCSAPSCAAYGAGGDAGAACSNGPSPAFPVDEFINLSCPCAGGVRCKHPSLPIEAPAGTKGVCCVNRVKCSADECNTTKVDECTGMPIACGCTTPGTHCNNASNQCVLDDACMAVTTGAAGSACSNGPTTQIPGSNGAALTCPCSAPGATCFSGTTPLPQGSSLAGQCCVPDVCPANSCGTITDHCSGQQIQCACGAGKRCDTGSSTCVANADCLTYGASGAPGAVCSNGLAFSDMGTPPSLFTCPCSAGFGQISLCVSGGAVVSGSSKGTCCVNTVACGQQCNVTLYNQCTGEAIVCGSGCNGTGSCSAGSNGTCQPYNTCAQQQPPANGADGAPCSTSPNPGFPGYPGDPSGLTCKCYGGRRCAVSMPNPHPAGPGELGHCCSNTNSCGNSCATSITDSCTGETIPCNCNGGTHCTGNTCVANKTCADYSANGSNGSACSNIANASFPGGPGGQNLTCPCSTGSGFGNITCSGATGSTPGVCTCTPRVATTCSDNGQSDGCGGVLSSPCANGTVCYQSACCTPTACSAGNAGDACGAVSSCGQSQSCGCTAQYQACGAVTPGVCGCKPLDQSACGGTGLPPGTHANGCGGFITCGG